MLSHLTSNNLDTIESVQAHSNQKWPTFKEILSGLHEQGIYINAEQLAQFFVAHGLPVDLRYVPSHLKQKAMFINENYRGDMACLREGTDDWFEDSTWL